MNQLLGPEVSATTTCRHQVANHLPQVPIHLCFRFPTQLGVQSRDMSSKTSTDQLKQGHFSRLKQALETFLSMQMLRFWGHTRYEHGLNRDRLASLLWILKYAVLKPLLSTLNLRATSISLTLESNR